MSHFFQNREGQTPIEEEMRFDLKLKHIQDMSELYQHERINNAVGVDWCKSTQKDHLDYMVWLEVHKHMYDEIWKFAGKVKVKEHANADFHLPFDVRPALLHLEKDLKFWIENKTYSPKEMMAIFHEKLLTIHPFKDGNGRWSRVLTEFICEREKVEVPNWGVAITDDKVRRDLYIDAIKEARHQHRFEKLIDVMWHS
jgi:fido (protein-threonine AMPylation protein)